MKLGQSRKRKKLPSGAFSLLHLASLASQPEKVWCIHTSIYPATQCGSRGGVAGHADMGATCTLLRERPQGMKNADHLEPCSRCATAAGDETRPLMSAQNRKVRVQMVGSNFGVNNVTAGVHPGSTVQTAAISVMVVGVFSQHFNIIIS